MTFDTQSNARGAAVESKFNRTCKHFQKNVSFETEIWEKKTFLLWKVAGTNADFKLYNFDFAALNI